VVCLINQSRFAQFPNGRALVEKGRHGRPQGGFELMVDNVPGISHITGTASAVVDIGALPTSAAAVPAS
jgi:hypothetical protein